MVLMIWKKSNIVNEDPVAMRVVTGLSFAYFTGFLGFIL